MIVQHTPIRHEIVESVCDKLLEDEREVLWERKGHPLFQGPMGAIRAIKERYGLSWRELRAVMYAM